MNNLFELVQKTKILVCDEYQIWRKARTEKKKKLKTEKPEKANTGKDVEKKKKKQIDSTEDTDIEEDVDLAENTVGQTSTTENNEYTLQQ